MPDFVRGDDLTRLQAAQRRVLPTWEEVQQKPPKDQSGNSLLVCFPHEEMELYQGAMDAGLKPGPRSSARRRWASRSP